MRIAVLSRNFSSSGGGAERYAIALVEQLAARHEVHVFAQTIAHQFPGVTYHLISMPLRKPRWINQLWFAYATWKATREGFDIVHSHENSWHGNVQTVHVLPVKYTQFAGRRGLGMVGRLVKVALSPRLLAYLLLEWRRFAYKPGRMIVVTSISVLDVMKACYPAALGMLYVISPGVATVPGASTQLERQIARVTLKLPRQGRALLFVGNDFKKKGLPALLQAMTQMHSEIWLAVVGRGEHLDAMQQRVAQLGLTERVFFVGSLTKMETAYQAADCLVHPTLEDTYAMVVLEAMAHALPVVVSGPQTCGISRELKNGHDALVLLDPRDSAEITQQVNIVLNDDQVASNLRRNGLAFAQHRTWEVAALEYFGLYQQALSTLCK